MIDIFAPRYKDNTVLVATYKIKNGENEIRFTKAKHLEGMVFSIDGDKARTYPVSTNGKIPVYVIPISDLKRIK